MNPQAQDALAELERRRLMGERLERFLRLTPRQQQVARLYAQGLSGKAVAAQLCVSPDTVKNHLLLVYRMLGLEHDRTKGRELANLIGFVEGFGARRIRMVTGKESEAA